MPAADAPAIVDAGLEALFGRFAGAQKLALAVSGGPDSLALLVLAHRWREPRATGPTLAVFTVDHGLRPSAAAEARMVADTAHRYGLCHKTLRWRGPRPNSRIEEAAREERYRLLIEAAEEAGISDILTAHHREDQVETVLMRLGKGSGLAGLVGMRPERQLSEKVTLHRPLLALSKAQLASTVASAGLTPVEDEFNIDERFARPRLRRLMPDFVAAGIGADGVAQAAQRLALADEAIEHFVDEFLRAAVSVDRFAVATIDRGRFRSVPSEVRRRVLARIIGGASGSDWPPPRGERLGSLERSVIGRQVFKRTLAGAVIAASEAALVVYRESGRAMLPSIDVAKGDVGIWDGRFAFRIEDGPKGLSVGALGEMGRRQVGARITGVPAGVVATLPALRVEGEIAAVPAIGLKSHIYQTVSVELECVLERRIWR